MICNIDESIIKGIKEYVDDQIDKSNLFDIDGDTYRAIDPREISHRFIISDINNSFSEKILSPTGEKGVFKLSTPSEKLLSQYRLRRDPSSNINVKLPYLDIADQKALFERIGIKSVDTPVDEVLKNMLGSQYSGAMYNMIRSNPSTKMEWSTTGECTYDPKINTVFISPEEIYSTAMDANLPFGEVFKILSLHEMAHAQYYWGQSKGANDIVLEKIRQKLLDIHKNTNRYEDGLRQGYEEDGIPYSLKNTFEMVADAKSNPWFKEWAGKHLSDIDDADRNRSFLGGIYDRVLSLFGVDTKPSFYDDVISIINDKQFRRANIEGSNSYFEDYNQNLKAMNGLPYNYFSSTYDVFTSEDAMKDMEKIHSELEDNAYKMMKYMDWETDKNNIQSIKKISDAFKSSSDYREKVASSINMLTQGARICKDILAQAEIVKSMAPGKDKLKMALALKNMSDAIDEGIANTAARASNIIQNDGERILLERIDRLKKILDDPMSTLEEKAEADNSIRDTQKSWASTNRFRQNLDSIAATPKKIKSMMADEMVPSMRDWLTSIVRTNDLSLSKREEIKKLKDDREVEQKKGIKDFKKIGFLSEQIKKREQELNRMPTYESFTDILQGLYQDASQMETNLDAPIANSHPLLGTLAEAVRLQDTRLAQAMNGAVNEHATMLEQTLKKLGIPHIRSTEDTYRPIYTNYKFVKEFIEDENGDIKPKSYITQRGFLSYYHPDYIQQAYENFKTVDHYIDAKRAAKKEGNDIKEQLYDKKLKDARDSSNKWLDENSERMYMPEVYDMYKMLDTPITKEDGTETTYGKERSNLYHMREEAENNLLQSGIEDMDEHIRAMKAVDIEIRQLSSPIDKYGDPKVGYELQLSQVAKKYSDLSKEYGETELTDSGKTIWEKHMLDIENAYNLGGISLKQKEQRQGEISVTELSDLYFQVRKLLNDNIDKLKNIIINTSYTENGVKMTPFADAFNNSSKETTDSIYQSFKNMTLGFKDNDNNIDGILFSQLRPELVSKIKGLHEELEQLRLSAQKLSSLPAGESNRFRELNDMKSKKTITDEQLQEYETLRAKLSKIKETYEKNKEVIDNYTHAVERLMNMTQSINTKYYQEALDFEKAKLSKELLATYRDSLDKNTGKYFGDGRYMKNDGEWMKVLSKGDDGNITLEKILIAGYSSNEDAMLHDMLSANIDEGFQKSKWFTDNHYKAVRFNEQSLMHEVTDIPIYIWTKSIPKNKAFINPNQPASMYKSFKIKDKYMNRNFKLLNDNIPVPKQGKFVNDEYSKIPQVWKDYLDFARRDYYKSQEYIPERRRPVDILPSFAKTHDENKVDLVKHVGEAAGRLLSTGVKRSESEDESIQWGGSNSDFNARNRVLPIRFVSKMDVSKQSSDIPAMLLGFKLAAMQYNERSKDQPLFESIRNHVENLSVKETKNLAKNGFNMTNIVPAIKSMFSGNQEPNTKTYTKDVKETNLKKGVDFILNTFQYDHIKDNNTVTINGTDYDLNQMSSQLKSASTLSIFVGNLFGALKVTGTGFIQGQINANVGKGYYTSGQYTKAYGEASVLIDSFIKDFSRFGNKTKIGQEMDYFQVAQGVSYNSYGQKTAFTPLKATPDMLMMFKGMSEFTLQLAQYLAMSKANPVKMANGKYVEWRDAFEVNRSTNALQPKEGAQVTQADIDEFTGKLSYINREINGAHRHTERNAFQKNILGDLAFYLNGHIVQGITNRFAGTRYSNDGDMITRGYYRDTASFIQSLVKYRQGIGKTWNTLNSEEKSRVWRTVTEVGIIMAMAGITYALGSADKKDELRTHAPIENWALALGLGVKAQIETLTPLPGLGLEDAVRKMNSPFAAMRQLTNATKLISHFGMFCVDDDKAFFTTKPYDDGLHDVGDPKFVADFAKLIGWSGIGFDALDRVQQVRTSQELR